MFGGTELILKSKHNPKRHSLPHLYIRNHSSDFYANNSGVTEARRGDGWGLKVIKMSSRYNHRMTTTLDI